jgi:hypothetical protein
LLDALSAWRQETLYADDDDFAFPSGKLGGKQPRSGSQLVEDYLRPAAIRAGVIREKDGITGNQNLTLMLHRLLNRVFRAAQRGNAKELWAKQQFATRGRIPEKGGQ